MQIVLSLMSQCQNDTISILPQYIIQKGDRHMSTNHRQFSSYRKLVILVHSNMNFIRPVTVRFTKLLTNGGLLDIPKVRYELGNFIT